MKLGRGGLSVFSKSLVSRHTGILMAIGWILPIVNMYTSRFFVFLFTLCLPVSLSHAHPHTHTHTHQHNQPTQWASQSVSASCSSVPVSSKLILLAEASGETSFSGRT